MWSNLSSLICSFTFVWVVFSFKNCEIIFHTQPIHLCTGLASYFLFFVQFSMIESRTRFASSSCASHLHARSALLPPLSATDKLASRVQQVLTHSWPSFPRQPWYYTTHLLLCQGFFQIFFKKISFSRFDQQWQNRCTVFMHFLQQWNLR